jgi:hypothetical protein
MDIRATGVLVVHSAPRALCSHIEWAVNTAVGEPLKYRWRDLDSSMDLVRVEVYLVSPAAGFAAALASSLTGWREIRFEITEDPGQHSMGARYSYTPSLGIFAAAIDAGGSTVLTEARIASIVTDAGSDVAAIRTSFDRALGGPWDRELEPYRAVLFDDSIRLLHRVG